MTFITNPGLKTGWSLLCTSFQSTGTLGGGRYSSHFLNSETDIRATECLSHEPTAGNGRNQDLNPGLSVPFSLPIAVDRDPIAGASRNRTRQMPHVQRRGQGCVAMQERMALL